MPQAMQEVHKVLLKSPDHWAVLCYVAKLRFTRREAPRQVLHTPVTPSPVRLAAVVLAPQVLHSPPS